MGIVKEGYFPNVV